MSKESTQSSERYGLIWAVVFIFLLSFLRGIRFPNLWSYTHFLFNYNQGFVKRGFIGEVLDNIGISALLSYEFFFLFSSAIIAVNIYLLVIIFRDLLKDSSVVAHNSTLIFSASVAPVFLAHIIGYADQLGLLVALVALRIQNVEKRLLFVSLAFPLVMLIHEANFVLFFPAVFIIFILDSGELFSKRNLRLFALSAMLILLSVVLIVNELDEPQTQAMMSELQSLVGSPELRSDAFMVLTQSATESAFSMPELWSLSEYRVEFIRSALITAPTIFYLLFASAYFLNAARVKTHIIVLAILASLSPILLNAFGWDTNRWFSFTAVTSFLVFAAIVKNCDRTVMAECRFLGAQWLLYLIIFVNASSTIYLFDNYSMQPFPYIEHLTYLHELWSGTATFPQVPAF